MDQGAEEKGKPAIHSSPYLDPAMMERWKFIPVNTINLDQIRPQNSDIGQLKKGVNFQEAISTPVLEKWCVYLYTHKVQGIPLHSQEPSISTKPPTALAQKRLQHDTEGEIQDNQGLRETCQLNFLLQNLEDDSFKHGQHRKKKEDILISSSYSYKIEKAVIKFGICTMKTVLLALAV